MALSSTLPWTNAQLMNRMLTGLHQKVSLPNRKPYPGSADIWALVGMIFQMACNAITLGGGSIVAYWSPRLCRTSALCHFNPASAWLVEWPSKEETNFSFDVLSLLLPYISMAPPMRTRDGSVLVSLASTLENFPRNCYFCSLPTNMNSHSSICRHVDNHQRKDGNMWHEMIKWWPPLALIEHIEHYSLQWCRSCPVSHASSFIYALSTQGKCQIWNLYWCCENS